MYGKINGIDITDVSATMLLTLYGRVIESRTENPLITDPAAEKIVSRINDSLLNSNRKLFRQLGDFRMRRELSVHAALRARQYDAWTREFMEQNPGCTVVSLGCGLDTRFHRVDDGKVRFLDLDLPGVIQLKRGLLEETERYRMLPCSVTDLSWLDALPEENTPILFIAEGLFMYLPVEGVISLLAALADRVKTGRLVAEVVNEKYTRGLYGKMVTFKFRYELGLGESITYNCGIRSSREMEEWSPRLHLIDDWCYFDAETDKLGWMRVLGRFKTFRKTQWTVRYRIGD